MVSKILSIFSPKPVEAAEAADEVSSKVTDVYKSRSYYGSSIYRQVFAIENGQREEFRAFLKNIFMQLDEDKFFKLIDSILENPDLSDEEIYEQLSKRIGEASPGFFQKIAAKFRSLSTLQRDLAGQVCTVMDDARKLPKIDGYMEIGYPGRMIRPLKGKFQMTGPKYVVNDKERVTDYLQSGFGPRPYNRFIELGDYTPISEERVPSNSLDMVFLPIGLHHAPTEKLDDFIDSIKRVLKPGGSFILMDHDAGSESMKTLASAVHGVFNAATGETPETDRQEIRNFESLQHWTNLLESHGLQCVTTEPQVREGDSTRNSIIRFVKDGTVEESAGGGTTEDGAQASEKAGQLPAEVRRAKMATFLTSVEWHNVRLYQGYGAFLEHTPSYLYNHSETIAGVWKVFGDSWNAARKYGSFSEVAFNQYTMMNLFLCIWITFEFALKGMANFPAYLLYGVLMKEDQSIHLQVEDDGRPLESIDDRIQVIEDTKENGVKHIVIPRYLPCTEIMRKFAEEGVKCVSMAGQKKVMIDLSVEPDQESPLSEETYCTKLYEIPPPAGYKSKTISYAVDIEELGTVLRSVDDSVVKKVFIHDF